MAISIKSTDIGRPDGFNSAAYKSNGLVFTSGNVGIDYSTGEYPEALEDQVHNCFKNLKQTLEGSGSSLEKVLKALVFVSNGDNVAKINEIYQTYFTGRPARACVIVQFPNPKILIEVECVAEASE